MFNALRLVTGAVLALATVSTPVAARDYHGYRGGYGYRHHSGIGVGGALLGAAIIGGIAVAASSANRDRYDSRYGYSGTIAPSGYGYSDNYAQGGYDYQRGDDYHGDYGSQRGYDRYAGADPVDACARAVEREVARNGDRGRVSGIDSVDPYSGGNTVRGRVEIDRGGRGEAIGFACNANAQGRTSLRLG